MRLLAILILLALPAAAAHKPKLPDQLEFSEGCFRVTNIHWHGLFGVLAGTAENVCEQPAYACVRVAFFASDGSQVETGVAGAMVAPHAAWRWQVTRTKSWSRSARIIAIK